MNEDFKKITIYIAIWNRKFNGLTFEYRMFASWFLMFNGVALKFIIR